ncbi:mucin-21 [Anopheles maculipalpis]|uniref:mucin-21 n=1 Tax=Anopheles maculipalpis TaxID=1496333 RepID=UPI00215949D5|nr:mucin-21 [Anopheles maculipalpis]
MSDYCTKMALLDDTNGNTVNINNQPSGEAGGPGDGCTVGGGMAPATGDTVTMLHSPSADDLSQSLSEYTDADESISAPTELLAEFLSAIMIRDYVNALKYCKQILQYEPNNTTARDFYPHILSKISEMQNNEQSGESDENYNFNCSSPLASSASSPSSCSVSSSPASSRSSRSASSASSSSSGCDNIDEVIMVCSSDSDESSEACCSCPDSIGNEDEGGAKGGEKKAVSLGDPKVEAAGGAIGPTGGSRSLSDANTSQSYSSLLLEDEEKDLTLSDISNLNIEEDETSNDCGGSLENSYTPLDVSGPVVKPAVPSTNLASATVFASRLVAMLRAKVIPSKAAGD